MVAGTAGSTTTKKCTHTVYTSLDKSTYHYTKCDICGKYKSRQKHSFQYAKYSTFYHKVTCSNSSCSYLAYKSHANLSDVSLTKGEKVAGTTYGSVSDLDTYHKLVCDDCGEKTGVSEHVWTGGDTSAHKCSGCGYVHSKANDATKGRHYFDIEKINIAGNVAPCAVCGEYLTLEYAKSSVLSKLPKKEEYTMVGNPNPMKEVKLDTDQKIVTNFMPINEAGTVIPLDENALKVRLYTHGNYFNHYAKLNNNLSDIAEKVNYFKNNHVAEFITNKVNELGVLGTHDESTINRIVDEVKKEVQQEDSFNFIDAAAVSYVISQLGDFAIDSINKPFIDWCKMGSVMQNTWLDGSTTTLRYEFKGSMTNSSNRGYTIYFSELPAGKYEIQFSALLTHGITFNILGYSLSNAGQMLYSTLFTKGGATSSPPSNIKAYISVAYRDTNGNVITNKNGALYTPKDTILNSVVYSGTSAKNVKKTFNAEMEWTQIAGYRYKGYLVKYGTYSIYNKPGEMTVTTNSSVSVTSSFSYSGLGISVVFYYEPVTIIEVQHQVSGAKIDTNKNLQNILIPTQTDYDVNTINYAPKSFPSLNKNFWPGYILTGYKVYADSVSNSNLIAYKTFDVNTTTQMNSKNDAKRYVSLLTAITSSSDVGGATVSRQESLGFGKDKIIIFEYLYPEVEVKNINYHTGANIKDLSGNAINYKIKLIGDNMLIKSLDTTKPRNNGYHELNVNLANGTKKNFKYDASNLSLVQVYIYTKDLNKGTMTLYKVIAGNSSFVPSSVPSNKVDVASDFSSFANLFILNTEDLITVMNKVWSDLYIEFRYYEGANILNVSYVDEEGNVLMPPEVYKILETENGKKVATVPITEIDGYELVKYTLDGKEEKNVNDIENVKVIDNGNDRELIFVYRKKKVEVLEEQLKPFAIIRSNDRDNEEYDVEVAMPTDEDLYANVVTDSYIIENVLSILDKKQSVNVILKKKYYTSNNDNDAGITSNIATEYATVPLIYDLDYQYFGGANASLFVIENAIIDNEAVLDKKHYEENGKVLIEADYGENKPYLTYQAGGRLFINNSEECTLIRNGDTYYLEVLLPGIDYEKPNMNSIANAYKNNHVEIDEIIRKNAIVNGDYLSVTAENKEIIYLGGNDTYMSADRLTTVTELADAGYYFINSIAPLTNRNILFNERNVYTYEKARNQRYDSTKLTVKYILHQAVKGDKIQNIDASVTMNQADAVREKIYFPSDIPMNGIEIYTPIVNGTQLIARNPSGENDNQLIDESIHPVLTLDSVFTINIPHAGMHNYAVNHAAVPYDGYGDKAYNFGGSKLHDEKDFTDKGLKNTTFAKMKLVKFTFDVYALKYGTDGKTIVANQLIPANTWFNLGELDKNTGLNIEKYHFIIPVWVQDKAYGDISVRIVAGNIPDEYDPKTADNNASFIAKDTSNRKDKYVLQEDFQVYIAGSLYDLEIRDSDDIGWVGKLVTALKLRNSLATNSSDTKNLYLPIGQYNQNSLPGYKMGLKLGYRFYFDLKTKGVASDEIIIQPNFYYVSADGKTVTKDISLFYSTKNAKYVKLNESTDMDVTMSFVATHGEVNNTRFNFELVKGKINNPEKNYTVPTTIGKIISGLDFKPVDTKLPRDNISEAALLYGYKTDTTKFVEEAKASERVDNEDSIRNATGHWYGEFYLPASTKVVLGSDVTANDLLSGKNKAVDMGYIIVTFDTIITRATGVDYLSYSKPSENMRWEKEGASYPYEVKLPNGNVATINMQEGATMAIYEASLRANDDYEAEGTH